MLFRKRRRRAAAAMDIQNLFRPATELGMAVPRAAWEDPYFLGFLFGFARGATEAWGIVNKLDPSSISPSEIGDAQLFGIGSICPNSPEMSKRSSALMKNDDPVFRYAFASGLNAAFLAMTPPSSDFGPSPFAEFYQRVFPDMVDQLFARMAGR